MTEADDTLNHRTRLPLSIVSLGRAKKDGILWEVKFPQKSGKSKRKLLGFRRVSSFGALFWFLGVGSNQ